MNDQPRRERVALAYVVAILGGFLIIGALSWAIYRNTQPPELGANRAEERAKALMEIRGVENEALNNTAWLDAGKGIVRLRIQDAMKLVEREWQNPPAARSNLLSRVEKANVAPPAPPQKPSEFE
jgi:hypothetical protein